MSRVAVYVLFLLSGATALVYEVAWTRSLVLELGSTTETVSLILAAYMAGLALGARIFGGPADRSRRPLLIYALLEAGIGVLAVLFPLLLGAVAALGAGRTGTLVLSFLVLLLPTTLMGGTLPVLSRFVVRSVKGMGGRIGLLYGLNTAGAVIGTFLAGFFLIRILGVYGSTLAAAAVNALVALAAFGLTLAIGRVPADPQKDLAARESPAASSLPRIAFLAAFASGLVSLASEVLWTRMLTFFLEGFTYTFSAMLTTFLIGLSLGALVSGRIVNRVRDLRRYVGWLFVVASFVSFGVLFALTRHFEVTNWAKDLTAGISDNWRVHHAASLFLASFVVLFPPALVMGGIFPAVARMVTRHAGEVGRRVGRVYAVNTVGSVGGSLLAGLVLVRLVGMAWGSVVMASIGAIAGLLLLGRRRLFAAAPFLAGGVVLVLLAAPGTPFILRSHVFKGERRLERKLVSHEEGVYGLVSVVEDGRNRIRAIYTDEFQAAATGPQYKYMRMLAHLPLLLAEKWEGAKVLVICFGTGTTAGSASVHPIGRLDIVEICPEVLDQADRFRDVNKGILDPGREWPFTLGVHVDDGRNYLLNTERRYDVITLEPLMPYTPGAVQLYTKDFYEISRSRLAPGGVMCQWIPIHAMSSDDFKMLIRSFTEVFPETSLWFVEGTSLVIGRTAENAGSIDYGRLLHRILSPGVGDDLDAIGYRDPVLALNTFVTGGEDLRKALADAAVMTDEHPYMEFRPVPYKWPNTFAADNLAIIHQLRRPIIEHIDLATVPEDSREDLLIAQAKAYQAGQAFIEARHFKERSAFYGTIGDDKLQEEYYLQSLMAYDRAVELNPKDLSARYLRKNAIYGWEISVGKAELKDGRLEDAEMKFARAAELDNAFKPDIAWTWLGRVRNRQGRYEAALRAIEKALSLFPKSPTALAERAFAKFKLGDGKGAAEDFEAAFRYPDVPPETDKALTVVMKRVLAMAEEGRLPVPSPATPAAASRILEDLRRAAGAEAQDLLRKLRRLREKDPESVRAALAPDLGKAREPRLPDAEQLFALKVLNGIGDTAGMIDLLKTGAPGVREAAADRLSLVHEKEVVPALAEAMRDPDQKVREAAWAATFMVTGRRVNGYDPAGPADKREAAIRKFENWWKTAEAAFEFR